MAKYSVSQINEAIAKAKSEGRRDRLATLEGLLAEAKANAQNNEVSLPPVGGGGGGNPPPPLLQRVGSQAKGFLGDLAGAGAQFGADTINGLQEIGNMAAFAGDTLARPVVNAYEGLTGTPPTRGFPEYGAFSRQTDPYLYDRKAKNGLERLAGTLGNFAGGSAIPALKPIGMALKAGGVRAGARELGGQAAVNVAAPAVAFEGLDAMTENGYLAGVGAFGANVGANALRLRGGKPQSFLARNPKDAEAALRLQDEGIDIYAGQGRNDLDIKKKQGVNPKGGTQKQAEQFNAAMMNKAFGDHNKGFLRPDEDAMIALGESIPQQMHESLLLNGADINVKISPNRVKKIESLYKTFSNATAGQGQPAAASRVVKKLAPPKLPDIKAPEVPKDPETIGKEIGESILYAIRGGDEGAFMRGVDIMEGSTPVGGAPKPTPAPRRKTSPKPINARTINNWRIALNEASITGSAHVKQYIHGLRAELDDILRETQGVNFHKLQESRLFYKNYKAINEAVLKNKGTNGLLPATAYDEAFGNQSQTFDYATGNLTEAGKLAKDGGFVLKGIEGLQDPSYGIIARGLMYAGMPTGVGAGAYLHGAGQVGDAAVAGALGLGAFGAPIAQNAFRRGKLGNKLLSTGESVIPSGAGLRTGVGFAADRARNE